MAAEIRTQHLFTVSLLVDPPIRNLGKTPFGERRIAKVSGGTFTGARLSGKVLDGGGDWILVRNDGAMQLDVRLILETNDAQMIYMTYRGIRHGAPAVMERVNRGDPVDPSEYYFRTAPWFETASEKYGWLNRIVAVSTGRRLPEGPVYDIFEVL
ncbi:MAG: DUF3237 domain-containing protein [Alphaproteobacteria bacterium]|nr:DUF3237 domain-containing protein [Alphaproteobacteria bacterium]